jgi:hypothetical protein
MRYARKRRKVDGIRDDAPWSFRSNLVAVEEVSSTEVKAIHTFPILVEEGIKVKVLEHIRVTRIGIEVQRLRVKLWGISSTSTYAKSQLLTGKPISYGGPIPKSDCCAATLLLAG